MGSLINAVKALGALAKHNYARNGSLIGNLGSGLRLGDLRKLFRDPTGYLQRGHDRLVRSAGFFKKHPNIAHAINAASVPISTLARPAAAYGLLYAGGKYLLNKMRRGDDIYSDPYAEAYFDPDSIGK